MPTRWVAYDDGVYVGLVSFRCKTTREIWKDKKYFKSNTESRNQGY